MLASFGRPAVCIVLVCLVGSVGDRASALELPEAAIPSSGSSLDVMEVVITPLKESFSSGAPIEATLKVVNRGEEEVYFDLGERCVTTVSLEITGPTGEELSASVARTPGGTIESICQVSLKPGESFEKRVVLNEWAPPIASVGRYSVLPRLSVSEGNVTGDAIGRAFVVEIVERDETSLEAVCNELARKARSPNAAVALEAARTLSYAADAACVPALESVLEDSFHGKLQAAAGLARIVAPEAEAALIRAWPKLDAAERAAANYEFWKRGRLEEFRGRLSDGPEE